MIFGEAVCANQLEVVINNPSIINKYRVMQMLISLCLLLLSTVTPAGRAIEMAGITSLNPRMPRESLLPVTS